MKGFLLFISMFLAHYVLAQPSSEPSVPIASIKSPNVYVQNGRMGLQKNLHKPITPAVYDTLYMVNESRYVGKRFNTTKQQAFWGIIDAGGNTVLPFKYRVLNIKQSVAIVGLPEHNLIKYGAYSLDGREIIVAKYESIKVLSEQLICAKINSNTAIFNYVGDKIFQIEADSIALLSRDYIKYSVNGKTGITRLNNDKVVSCNYRDVKMVSDDIWIKKFPHWQIIIGYDTLALNYDNIVDWQDIFIATSGRKSLLIDRNDKTISASYDSIIKVNESFALVKKGDRWGVLNIFGEEIVPINYSRIISDEEVIYARSAGTKGKWSLFDYYGFRKTKLTYDSITTIAEGRIGIKRNGKWGFIDRYGVEAITPIFDRASQFKHGFSIVTFFGEDGIIDRNGKWAAIPALINIHAYDNNILLGTVNGQYQVKKFNGELVYFTRNKLEITNNGFLERDSSGVALRNISWNGTHEYFAYGTETVMTGGSGLIIFKESGKYGFKDQRKRIIIANRYEAVKPFHQRLAAIKINGKWGFINLDEQIIVQPRYDSVGHFNGNSCITKKNNLLGIISRTGKEITPNQYQQILLLGNGQFIVKKDNRWGVLSEDGSIIIHAKYNILYPVSQSFYIVERNGKYGTIGVTGISKIPLLYDFIGYNDKSKTMVTKMSYKNEWAFLMKTHSANN